MSMKQKQMRYIILTFFFLPFLTGCSVYKLSGITISSDIQTYYVGNFKVSALNAPATINQTFQEALKDKVARESRLKFTDQGPHLEFNGSIIGFTVSAVAPQPGERTSFNRLTVQVSVEYINHLNSKEQWTKTFSHFEDFPAEQNLLQVQDDLIVIIFNQILEDIFNQAFNNW